MGPKLYPFYFVLVSAGLLTWQWSRQEFDDTLRRIGRHWLPFTIFFLLCFAASGLVLPGLGIPHLFRDDPDLTGWGQLFNSSVFWTQFGITILLFLIWVYIYRLEVLEHVSCTRIGVCRFALTYGLPMTLYVVGAAALPATGLSWAFADLLKGVLGVVAAALVFVLAIRTLQRAHRAIRLRGGLVCWPKIVSLLDRLQFLVVGPVVSPRVASGGHAESRAGRLRNFRLMLKSVDGPDHRLRRETIVRRGQVARAVVLLGIMWILIPTVSAWHVLQAGVSIVLLMSWALLLLFTLGFMRPFARFWTVLILAGLVLGLNFARAPDYKYTFPGLRSHYDRPLLLREATSTPPRISSGNLLQPVSTLEAWKSGAGEKCSHLIIVATSGGAYRSAYWTAAVLDELERLAGTGTRHEKLSNCIRLVTGASGGMVGAGYYVAMKNEAALCTVSDRLRIGSVIGRLNDDTRCARARRIDSMPECTNEVGHFPTFFPYSRDSLTPVAHQLIHEDIELISWSNKPRSTDRGRVLEDQWLTLNRTFQWLQEQEKAGRIPSLLLTPLAFWTETHDQRGGIKEKFAVPLIVSNLNSAAVTGSDSRRALELFRLFPEAVGHFKIKTAVRMNATFPYVSPAVALPTKPPVRVVDAGYYENYGVAAAAAWLFAGGDQDKKGDQDKTETPMQWLARNGVGVILIQIRAYPFASAAEANERACRPEDSRERGKERKAASGGRDEYGKLPALQSFTSPLEAIVAVRDSGMNIRNDQEIRLLGGRESGFTVETVAFENTLDVGMSWYLVPEEVECLEREVRSEFNCSQWTKLLGLIGAAESHECATPRPGSE